MAPRWTALTRANVSATGSHPLRTTSHGPRECGSAAYWGSRRAVHAGGPPCRWLRGAATADGRQEPVLQGSRTCALRRTGSASRRSPDAVSVAPVECWRHEHGTANSGILPGRWSSACPPRVRRCSLSSSGRHRPRARGQRHTGVLPHGVIARPRWPSAVETLTCGGEGQPKAVAQSAAVTPPEPPPASLTDTDYRRVGRGTLDLDSPRAANSALRSPRVRAAT